MRSLAVLSVMFALAASPLYAQGRGRNASQGIPPGQLPPAGMCRVWYDGVPPGRQPRPTNCDQAERIASRDRNARVIYGNDYYSRHDRYGNDDRYRDNDDRYRNNNERYRDNYPYGNNRYPNGSYAYNTAAYDKGYRDGLEKGRDDARHNKSYDPVRQDWYRDGDRGYKSRYGSKDQYKLAYRDGFEAGYRSSYESNARYSNNRGTRLPWPF